MSRSRAVVPAAGSVARVDTTGDGVAGRSSFGPRPGGRLGGALLHATLWFTPYPMARALRRRIADAGAATNQALEQHAPADVEWWFDEPSGAAAHEVYDLYRPFDPDGARPVLPAIVWVHGGAFVGGDKAYRRGWSCLLASRGFAVVVPRLTLAPEVEYPAPVQQVVDVLAHLTRDADGVGVDADRVVVAGDSTGALIAAQAAAVVADPDYAEECGVEVAEGTPVPAGAVLCGGPYDRALVRPGRGPGADVDTCAWWSYSGNRAFRTSRVFASMSVVEHVTPGFPPTLVTVGGADPLAPHTASLVRALEAQGVRVEQAGSAEDHDPAAGPDYQFDLSRADARATLERIVEFARECAR